MKWILLVLPVFAAYVAACSSYRYCHCYNDDKLPNNNATTTVCNAHPGVLDQNTAEYPGSNPAYYECEVADWAQDRCRYWDNCRWRDACAAAGATGKDSSCREKVTYC